MRIILSSKNMKLTDGFKTFLERKLTKLKKFTSLGLSNIRVMLDVNRRRGGIDEEAVVEIVSDINHKTIAVRQKGKTFYQAFFSAVGILKRKLAQEHSLRMQ